MTRLACHRRLRRLAIEVLEPRSLPAIGLGLALGLSTGPEYGAGAEAVAVDSNGNVLVAGNFSGNIDLDPRQAGGELGSAGWTDLFVAKFDPDGNLLWARSLGGTEYDAVRDLCLDGSGNIYLAGSFRGTVDFDPSSAVAWLMSTSESSAFVLKLTPAGDFAWARPFSGSGFAEASGVAVDQVNRVVVVGTFTGTVGTDPFNPAKQEISAGDMDCFVVQLNSSGNHVWSGSIGGTRADYPSDVAVDSSGNVFVAGNFSAQVDFDLGSGVFSLTGSDDYVLDAFVVKTSSTGVFSWAKTLGGVGVDRVSALAADTSGGVYVAGSFQGTAKFSRESGEFQLVAQDQGGAGADAFIARLAGNGQVRWVTPLGSDSAAGESVAGIRVSSTGQVYVTGVLAVNGGDAFVACLADTGNPNWTVTVTGANRDAGRAVGVDGWGNVYAVGSFGGTGDFDPGPETFPLVAGGGATLEERMFLWKLTPVSVGDFVWIDLNGNGLQDAGEPGRAGVEVRLIDTVDGIAANADDRLVATQLSDSGGRYGFSDVAAGTYYLEFRTASGLSFTVPRQGDRPSVDSDPDAQTARTLPFVIAAGRGNTTLDAGLIGALHPWQNPREPRDVNNSGNVSPVDVLLIVNDLNLHGTHRLPTVTPDYGPPPFLDVNGNDYVAPVDVLLVINYLNQWTTRPAAGEGEDRHGAALQDGLSPAPAELAPTATGEILGEPVASPARRPDNRRPMPAPMPGLDVDRAVAELFSAGWDT